MCEIDGLKSKPMGQCQATVFSTHEVWLPVPNYPHYEVSNTGGLRRLKSTDALGRTHMLRYLNGRVTSRSGVRVALYHNGVKDFLLARLVATTFYEYDIDTPLTVNHMDGNRYNNDINNLELVTREENNTHAHTYGLMDAKYKKTILFDTMNNKRLYFKSQTKASQFLGRNNSYIANSKRDGRLQYGQYILEV